jgi:hypothetical protein
LGSCDGSQCDEHCVVDCPSVEKESSDYFV